MLLFLACSDYALDTKPADPIDTSSDPRVDDTHVGPDDSGTEDSGPADSGDWLEEEDYCTPFDDFSGWSYTGEGEWHVESGMLTEGRYGAYAAMAYTSDMGSADRFMLQVDTAWGGNANDLTGIAWGISGESGWVARWDDPQDYYDRHNPTGSMDISRCDENGCTPLVTDATADLYWPEGMVFVTWSVRVEGSDVLVLVDGKTALHATVPEIAGTGPGVVGVYSNDNDGGVWFDNFCVWTSE